MYILFTPEPATDSARLGTVDFSLVSMKLTSHLGQAKYLASHVAYYSEGPRMIRYPDWSPQWFEVPLTLLGDDLAAQLAASGWAAVPTLPAEVWLVRRLPYTISPIVVQLGEFRFRWETKFSVSSVACTRWFDLAEWQEAVVKIRLTVY